MTRNQFEAWIEDVIKDHIDDLFSDYENVEILGTTPSTEREGVPLIVAHNSLFGEVEVKVKYSYTEDGEEKTGITFPIIRFKVDTNEILAPYSELSEENLVLDQIE